MQHDDSKKREYRIKCTMHRRESVCGSSSHPTAFARERAQQVELLHRPWAHSGACPTGWVASHRGIIAASVPSRRVCVVVRVCGAACVWACGGCVPCPVRAGGWRRVCPEHAQRRGKHVGVRRQQKYAWVLAGRRAAAQRRSSGPRDPAEGRPDGLVGVRGRGRGRGRGSGSGSGWGWGWGWAEA